ncbi:MAG: hypothetical protein ACI80V_003090 [Rhodothermales bacterium]
MRVGTLVTTTRVVRAWILALAACSVGCSGIEESPIRFEDLTEASALDFQYFNGMTGRMTFVEIAGGGVATLDYDRDGDMDVYLVQGQHIHNQSDASLTDRLFRNDSDGPGSIPLVDVTESSGVTASGYGMGVAVGDINNDGWPDLYLTNWGRNQLWVNNGDGTFSELGQPELPDESRWSVAAAFLDFDRDGWQDIVVANYVDYTLDTDHPCTSAVSGRRDYCGPKSYRPVSNTLLRNMGDGSLKDVTYERGLGGAASASMGIAVSDFDHNGWTDIYVANDGSDNRLWMNTDGVFRDEAVRRGAAVNMRGVPEASMGVAVADFDGDTDSDLFLTHLNGETNTLYLNDGEGYFDDASRQSQAGSQSIPYTSFGVVSRDFDLDGWVDLFVANGDVRILAEQVDAGDPFPLRQPNQLFRNGPAGLVELEGWIEDGASEVSRGVAAADLDNDGLVDLVISNNSGPAQVLRNTSRRDFSWAGVQLEDPAGSAATGAEVHLSQGTSSKMAIFRSDGGYASSSDPRLVFGLVRDSPANVRVIWPDGLEETWTLESTNNYVILQKGNGTIVPGAHQ